MSREFAVSEHPGGHERTRGSTRNRPRVSKAQARVSSTLTATGAEMGNRPGLCEAAFQPGTGPRSSRR